MSNSVKIAKGKLDSFCDIFTLDTRVEQKIGTVRRNSIVRSFVHKNTRELQKIWSLLHYIPTE